VRPLVRLVADTARVGAWPGDTGKIVFADHVIKVNRKFKKERRSLLITNKAIYVLDDKKLTLIRRIDLARVSKLILSQLAGTLCRCTLLCVCVDGCMWARGAARPRMPCCSCAMAHTADSTRASTCPLPLDNYLVLQVDGEYDQLLENNRKTEIAICLREVASAVGRKVEVVFSNEYVVPQTAARLPCSTIHQHRHIHTHKQANKQTDTHIGSSSPTSDQPLAHRITYSIKGKKTRTIKLQEDASAPETGNLQPTGERATIAVSPGLPNTSGMSRGCSVCVRVMKDLWR
jgi:hypothetical protein